MRRALLGVLLALAPSAAVAEDPAAPPRAGIGWSTPRTTVYVGEPFPLHLYVDCDRAWIAEHGVPLFVQALDLPLEIEASALDRLAGADSGPARAALGLGSAARLGLAINGRRVEGTALEGTALEGGLPALAPPLSRIVVTRWCAATAAGTLEVGAPGLHFVYATRFREDALGERVPEDPREVRLDGLPLRLEVRALPPQGRPAEHGDALGRFTLSGAVDRDEVEVGRAFTFTLVIEGSGNLEALAPPRLDTLAGLHLYGLTDDHGFPRRTLVHQLAAERDDVAAVPPIELVYFDPAPPGAYRSARTPAVPLRVRGPRSVPVVEPSASDEPGAHGLVLGLGAALALLLLMLLRWNRPRAGRIEPPLDLERARFERAVAALRGAPPPADVADLFAEVLAARLGQPRAAAIGPDLAARLMAAGAAPGLALEAAETLQALVAARYGGARADPALAQECVRLGEGLRGGSPLPPGST